MCGLVCIIGKSKSGLFMADATLMRQMMFADTLRGPHSTGVFGIDKDGDAKIVKAAQQAPIFLETETYKQFESQISPSFKALVGHNRWATKGEVKDQNAHPFHAGNIVLAHNGTIQGHRQMANVDVDSEALAINIDEKGIDETVKEIDGAFAMIWYDDSSRSINFMRNNQRPLHLFETHNTYIIVSEEEMANWILSRNHVKIVEEKEIPENTLFSFDLVELKLTTRELEVKKKVYQSQTTQQYTPGMGWQKPTNSTSGTTTTPGGKGYSIETWKSARETYDIIEEQVILGSNHIYRFNDRLVAFKADDYRIPKQSSGYWGDFFVDLDATTRINVFVNGGEPIDRAIDGAALLCKINQVSWDESLKMNIIRCFLQDIEWKDQVSYNNVIVNQALWNRIKESPCVGCQRDIQFCDISDTVVNLKGKAAANKIRKLRCTCFRCANNGKGTD